jgi:hypothetical protein
LGSKIYYKRALHRLGSNSLKTGSNYGGTWTPKMLVNDVEYRIKEGDAFRIEPLEKHDIVNDTREEVKLIFIKTPYLPQDKITY